MTKITQAERQAWLMRPQTYCSPSLTDNQWRWGAGTPHLTVYANTKFAAIDAAIRAERKAKK